MARIRRPGQRVTAGSGTHPYVYLSLLSSCFLYQSCRVHALVPPHPDSGLAEHWGSVHHDRSPLDYMPRFVHPELCRYLNDQECHDVDASLHDHATRHRSLWQRQESYSGKPSVRDPRMMMEDRKGVPLPSKKGGGKMIRRNPSSVAPGDPVIEILVVLMRFQDHRDRPLPPKEEYERLWNERIRHWFDLNSYGNYRFHATVTDWMDTDDTEMEYASGVSGLRYNLQQSFWPILDQLNERDEWDWSKFDGNKDGKLDAVVVLHSGYPAEVGGYDCTNHRPVEDRIWSHAFASSFSWSNQGIMDPAELQTFGIHQQPQPNSTQPNMTEQSPSNSSAEAEPLYALHGYVMASGLNGTCGSDVAKMGVMVHEYMHTLGLDDVYDYGTDSPGKGIGIWDLMGYPYGAKNKDEYPGHLSAYSKLELGWLTPTVWKYWQETDLNITLQPAETSNQAIIILLTNGTSTSGALGKPPEDNDNAVDTRLMPQYQSHDGVYQEYLLLEYRQATEFDRDLGDNVGLVVYHVDEAVSRMNNRGYPGQQGWPQNGNHYRVAVLGADGLYDLERGANSGDSTDAWKPGFILGPGSAPRVAAASITGDIGNGDGRTTPRATGNKMDRADSRSSTTITYPNTDMYQHGIVRETGLFIKNVSESPTLVTIRLSWQDVGLADTSDLVFAGERDCLNMWDWVNLNVELEDGQTTVEALHCSVVATDTDYYCSMQDFSWGLEVWEICRNECPNSDCNDP